MKSYSMVLLSVVLLIVFSMFLLSQTNQEIPPPKSKKVFQPSELKEDMRFLFKTLEEVHPNLYAYTKKSVIDKERERIEKSITSPLSRIDFYIKIAPLVAKLGEGHTGIWPLSEYYWDYVGKGGLVFPFDLKFREGKAFIVANHSLDPLITVGSELLSINGIPMEEMFDNLIRFFKGERASFRTRCLENNFRLMLLLVYKFQQNYELEIILLSTGERLTRRVRGVTFKTIATQRDKGQKEGKPVFYSYRSLPEEKTGIIDFRSFRDLKQFKKFLKKTFALIKKDGIENLIIDIRENGGGDSTLGDVLLGYITDKPFTQFSRWEIKVSKQIRAFYQERLPKGIRWIPIESLYSRTLSIPEGGIYAKTMKPKAPGGNPLRFNGKVYVLTGASTFSSATAFASAIKDFKLGILVGEETGGLATSYGDVYRFKLPNTKINVGVSHKRFVRPSGEDDGRGVLPDYEVMQTLEDKEKGIDTVMEFTRNLIKSNSQKIQK